MGRHVATKTSPADLDDDDRRLLDELREARRSSDESTARIAELRGRGVDAGMIAEAYGVTKGRVYQIEPAAPA